jgi:hypothetical protein
MVRGVDIRTFSADWDKLGAAAGPVRNQKMLVEGRPDLVVAFPGGKGTADMVRRSERAGISAFRPLVPKGPEVMKRPNFPHKQTNQEHLGVGF